MLGLGNILTKGGAVLGFPNKYSFNFDASNDYLDCGNPTDLQITGAMSISAWVKTSTTDFKMIVSKDDGSSNRNWHLKTESNGYVRFQLWSGGSMSNSTGDINIADGDWHHIAVTYNPSTAIKIYVDGTLDENDTSSIASSIDNDTVNLNIGRIASGNYFNGDIDEVAIWNAVLSDSDITKIASKPVDFSKASTYATDRTSNLKLWLRAGDKVLPEEDTSIARSDFYTDFDGTDDHIVVSDNSALDFGTGNFTVALWHKSDAQHDQPFINKKTTFSDNTAGWTIYMENGNDQMRCRIAGGSSNVAVSAGTKSVSDNNWHFTTMVRSGDNLYLYTDGVLEGSTTGVNSLDVDNSDDLYIGRGGSLYPQVDVSSASLYQTALDAQTISQMAKSRFTPMRDNRFSVVDFDGTNDYITSSVSNFRNTDSSGGITAWVKLDSTGWMTIFSSRQASSTNYYVTLGIAGGTNGIFVASKNNDSASDVRGATDISGGGWHHVAVISDGSEYKLYVDGVLETLGTNTNNDGDWFADTTNTDVIRIGDDTGGTGYFNGDIASVAVYSSLSEDEVYAQYAKGITANHSSDTNLVGYWRMGDDTSKAYPTIADSSSNSNDGTITNGASDDIQQQMVAGWDLGAFESSSEETLELVSNGNLEESSNSPSISGVAFTYYNGSGARSTDFNNGGSHSYKFTGGDQNDHNAKIIPNDSSLVGKILSISVDVYTPTSGGSSGNIDLRVINHAGGASTLESTSTKDAWVNLSGVFVYDGTSAQPINVQWFTADSVIYLDNISITEVLQSADLSDTYYTLVDVNEPVLGAELVANGTMEADSNWSNYNSPTTNERSSEQAHSGTYSRKFTTDANYEGIISDGYTTTTGKHYIVSFWVYPASITSIRVRMQEGDGSGNIATSSTTNPTFSGLTLNAWNQVSFNYQESSGGSSGKIVMESGANTGSNSATYYIDDVTVKELQGNAGKMTNMASSDLVYSSVLPDQSFLTGVNSAYNFIDLDGSNEYIDCGDDTSLDITGNITLTCWVKPDAVGAVRTIFGRDDSTNRNYFFMCNSSNQFNFSCFGLTDTTVLSSTTFSAGNWYHLIGTYDGARLKLYINGVLETNEASTGTINNTDVSFTIGARESGMDRHWDGGIANVGVWNKALSSTEVSAIYTLGRHGNLLDSYSDNLKGYWAMGALDASTGLSDVGNGTIYDRSGQSNHGTATNTESADLKSSPNAESNGYAKGDTNRSTTTP